MPAPACVLCHPATSFYPLLHPHLPMQKSTVSPTTHLRLRACLQCGELIEDSHSTTCQYPAVHEPHPVENGFECPHCGKREQTEVLFRYTRCSRVSQHAFAPLEAPMPLEAALRQVSQLMDQHNDEVAEEKDGGGYPQKEALWVVIAYMWSHNCGFGDYDWKALYSDFYHGNEDYLSCDLMLDMLETALPGPAPALICP